jgi:hypothetical protein
MQPVSQSDSLATLKRSLVTCSLLANGSRDECGLAVGSIRVATWFNVSLSGVTCSHIAIAMSALAGEPGNRRRAVFPAYLTVVIPIRQSDAF